MLSAEGHGLSSQRSRCEDYCRNKGYEMMAVFTDDVSGGGDFMKRPGMVNLLNYLGSGLIKFTPKSDAGNFNHGHEVC